MLARPCPECGYDTAGLAPTDVGAALLAEQEFWSSMLEAPRRVLVGRPRPDSWSPTEYACHVRDVHRLFAERVQLMLTTDDAVFANWDQDATAVERRYDLAEPAVVVAELVDAAASAAAGYDAIADTEWGRTGVRSNGSEFTVATLGLYHLHDVVHHRWDVARILRG